MILVMFYSLQINETLRTLKMNGNKIDNKGGMAIAGALQVNTILDDIDLAETDLVRVAYFSFFKGQVRGGHNC